jgi:hypothetical protein
MKRGRRFGAEDKARKDQQEKTEDGFELEAGGRFGRHGDGCGYCTGCSLPSISMLRLEFGCLVLRKGVERYYTVPIREAVILKCALTPGGRYFVVCWTLRVVPLRGLGD